MTTSQRFALALSYEGTAYHGWQKQENLITLRSTLEQGLSTVANQPIRVICAGRTDAGVHASEQIVHFDTTALRSERAWVMGANANLPRDMSVQWVKAVPEDFNARISAAARTYRYVIYNEALRPGVLQNAVTWYYYPLDEQLMHQAVQLWVGKHDFTSFRASGCQAKTPVREIFALRVYRQQALVIFEVCGNAFLHHMVRNMVGVLFMIGRGLKAPSWAAEVLQARDRRIAGMMAPPTGLYLAKVSYPVRYELPNSPFGPFFLSGSLL